MKTNGPGDCYAGGTHGSLQVSNVATRGSWSSFATSCLAACRDCPRCRFVSMSHEWRDCSWAYECRISRLHRDVPGFRSARAPLIAASPPPPPYVSPPTPMPSPPLPTASPMSSTETAFRRAATLSFAQLERGLLLGDSSHLRRKLRSGGAVTLAAIGASNTVRGGCEAWQGGKCASARYTARDADGSPQGWLLQAFEALNHSWPVVATPATAASAAEGEPTSRHRLVNRAMMATGPEAFASCVRDYVPDDVDALLVGFADMCAAIGEDGRPETVRETLNSTFFWSLEAIVRSLRSRPRPPAIVLFNIFKWTDFWLGSGSTPVRFSQGCDAAMTELAQFYRLSSLSMRSSLWHDVHPTRASAADEQLRSFRWQRWTTDGGRHLDLGRGDRMAAEMVHHWLRRVAAAELPDAAPPLHQMRWLSEHRSGAAVPSGRASCFSFDDSFGGVIGQPRVVQAAGWARVDWVRGAGGRTQKLKPGYVATQRGAQLLLDTQRSGEMVLRVGYLKTHNSSATARLSCAPPCACTAQSLRARAVSNTATTQMSSPLSAMAPLSATCNLQLELLTDAQPFKFIVLQVDAATAAFDASADSPVLVRR